MGGNIKYIKLAYPCIVLAVIYIVICGIIYPLAVVLASGIAFPWQAGGSPVTHDGSVVGSALIGQNFTGPGYFHSRPSAVGYDASSSGASNLGPGNPELLSKVKSRIPAGASSIPGDAVLGSGSGLDPDISIENAMMQAPAVASENGLSEESVKDLIKKHEQGRFLGLWGEPRANVLELNLALDELKKGSVE